VLAEPWFLLAREAYEAHIQQILLNWPSFPGRFASNVRVLAPVLTIYREEALDLKLQLKNYYYMRPPSELLKYPPGLI
jgi:hypothetical protein